MRPSRVEYATDQIGVLLGDFQKGLVAGDFVVSHRRLVHVADAVLFVNPGDVRPELLRLPLGHGIEGEQIAVFPLGRADDADQAIQVRAQLRVGVDLQRVGGAFHDLVDVRVVERGAFVFALLETGRLFEIADPVGFLALS